MKDQREINRLVREQLEWIGLPGIENKAPSELSGGMKKRVGVARTLVTKPEVLLFDEPTTGLDPVLGETINDLVLRVNRELGLTCILITHDIQATFRISDKIAFLHDGEVAESGTPKEVSDSSHPMVRKFIENSFNSLEV
ncbi:MAG: ABC transporter ATP-binding protein, partial [Alkalispirochaetaceae bacterium]